MARLEADELAVLSCEPAKRPAGAPHRRIVASPTQLDIIATLFETG